MKIKMHVNYRQANAWQSNDFKFDSFFTSPWISLICVSATLYSLVTCTSFVYMIPPQMESAFVFRKVLNYYVTILLYQC